MKRFILVSAALLALTACGQSSQAPASEQKPVAEIVPEEPKIDHYYSMKDGFSYGYQKELSADSASAGIAAEPLVMVLYAGEKEGKYQVFSRDGSNYLVVQCENPCQYLKIMTFLSDGGAAIDVKNMQALKGIMAESMITDAINGKLEQFTPDKNGKKYHVWFDEHAGFTTKLVDKQ